LIEPCRKNYNDINRTSTIFIVHVGRQAKFSEIHVAEAKIEFFKKAEALGLALARVNSDVIGSE